jgi:hypothetical protein
MKKALLLFASVWFSITCAAQDCDAPCQMQKELDEFAARQAYESAKYRRERQRYIDSLKSVQIQTSTSRAKMELESDYKTTIQLIAQLESKRDSVLNAKKLEMELIFARLNSELRQLEASENRQLTVVKAQIESKFRFKWQELPQSVIQSCVRNCPSLLSILQQ